MSEAETREPDEVWLVRRIYADGGRLGPWRQENDPEVISRVRTHGTAPGGIRAEARLLAALAVSAGVGATVPAGWRMVPVEPTPEMIREALPMYAAMLPDSEWPFTVNLYRAMIGAAPAPLEDASRQSPSTATLIKHMVDRFLRWRIPKPFNPDGGISFKTPNVAFDWPVGTNLLTANQAEAMIRYMLEGAPLPAAPELPAQPEEVLREARKLAKTLRDRHYPEVTQWEPAGDLVGLLLQIDNMTAGLSRPIAPEDSETCALCEFPILSDDELELDEDGEAMHRGCRKLATREMERAAAEASRSPRPAEASAPVAEGVRNERFIMEDDDGPTVGILIDLPDGTQIWSSDISSATFAEQTSEVREAFDGRGLYVVCANRGNGIEIIAQVPTVDLGIEVARAVAAAALRSANARQPSKGVDRG